MRYPLRDVTALTRRAGFGVAVLVSVLAVSEGCAVPTPAPPTRPTTAALAEVTVDVSREWTDTDVTARAGDRLVFWSTGTIRDVRRPKRQADPDGITPSAERVGPGGLVGRVGTAKPFDIGARTHLIWKGAYRSYRLVAPPPLEMSVDGPLRLGVRDWKPGRFEGTFLVSIWRASPASSASAQREARMPWRMP